MPVQNMKRTISLWGAIATLIGFVIGATVFILPAELAQQTGPAVVVSITIAALMAMFFCFVGAQIGAVFPISGASFLASSKLISPFFGFMYMWLVLAGVVIGIAVVALGFAYYFNELVPGLPTKTVAILVVILFAGINLYGSKTSITSQGIMVVFFMSVLVAFTLFGAQHIETERLLPFAPNGFGSVLSAAIPAYFSFIGFQIIIEIGGEVKRPGRNIPLALLISFITVLATYIVVSIVIVGIIPWQDLAKTSTPFSHIAEQIMPAGAANVIALTILVAAASSINGLLFGFSRDVMMLSRVGLFPAFLGQVSKRSGQPANGIVLLSLFAVIALLVGGSVTEYAIVTVVGIMFGQILMGLSTLRIPKVMPASFHRSQFKLGRIFLPFFAIGLICFSILFIVVSAISSAKSMLVVMLIIALGTSYYLLRRRYLNQHNIDITQSITKEMEGL
jgi:APA family basic amino acid/polyamine antiporter